MKLELEPIVIIVVVLAVLFYLYQRENQRQRAMLFSIGADGKLEIPELGIKLNNVRSMN